MAQNRVCGQSYALCERNPCFLDAEFIAERLKSREEYEEACAKCPLTRNRGIHSAIMGKHPCTASKRVERVHAQRGHRRLEAKAGVAMLCVSHESALFYWRTNPPWYVLEGADRNIRSLRGTPTSVAQLRAFDLPEAEFGPGPIDILVPPDGPRCDKRFRKHVQKAELPPHALYPIRDGIHVVSPELCLVQLCQSRTLLEALEIGMELSGTYALRPESAAGMSQRDYSPIDPTAFRRHVSTWSGIHGLVRARRAASLLAGGAASPMEAKMYLLLCLPQKLGGYHLPQPELNPEIGLDSEGRLLLRKNKVYPDFLWRKSDLIVEYDGGYHLDEMQSAEDAMRRIVLETMGYTVLQVRKEQLKNPIALHGVAHAIAKRIGWRIRPTTTLAQELAREDLHRQLMGKTMRRGPGISEP